MMHKLFTVPVSKFRRARYMQHTLTSNYNTRAHTSRLYYYGEYRAEDQEQMLENLDKKVSEVYASCIGANEANIS